MATRYAIPKPTEPLLDQFGKLSAPWYNYLRTRFGDAAADDIAQQIADLTARVEALEADEGTDARIIGPASVTVLGTLADGLVQVLLDGDQVSPLPVSFYSTGEDSVKGWNLLFPNWVPNPYADYLVDEDGNYLTDENGNFLTAQDGFPIPLEYGGTGADNSSVAANLVWASPDGLAGAPVFRALVGDDLPAPLPTLVAGGTTAQFWRGDGTWSNVLTGGLTVDTNTLVVDAANDRLGAGTATPLRKNHMMGPQGPVASFPASIGTNTPLLLENNGSANFSLLCDTTGSAGMACYESAGAMVSGFFRYEMVNNRWLADVEGNSIFQVTATGAMPAVDNTLTNGGASFRWSSTYVKDLILGLQAASLGGGVGVAFISNASTVPTSNPANGGILYVSGGALFYRGSAGTVTPLAPA
jgi:hypothetical protein